MTDYKKLQNGSDVRGIALDGVDGEKVNLTPQIACDIAYSYAQWLANKLNKNISELKIAVGNDSRLSGEALKEGVTKALSSLNITVYDCGLASTPAMFMSTVLDEFMFDGSIMLTASHLPFNRNGLKFFTKDGGLEHEDIEEILANTKETNCTAKQDFIKPCHLMTAYAKHLREVIQKGINSKNNYEKPLIGFNIAVDAGNGAGGFFVNDVLIPLGAETKFSRFLNPDGNFPNHIPNPENKEAMKSIKEAVLHGKCDLGIIFDTDVDRAGAVDSEGNELSRNRFIALMSEIVSENNKGCTIVTDSVTSSHLKTYIEDRLGCKHHRYMRGYKNVINEAIRLNKEGIETPLAIETSGHGALKENYFLDDGAYLSAKIIIKLYKLREENTTITELLNKLSEPKEAEELRLKIEVEDFKSYGQQVLSDLIEYAKAKENWIPANDNHEGFRATVKEGNGWFLVRMSLHDPQIPINIESDSVGGAKIIRDELYEFMKQYNKLNLTAFNK